MSKKYNNKSLTTPEQELTEQQKIELRNQEYEEMKIRINESPVVYEWSINVPPPPFVNILAIFTVLTFTTAGVISSLNHQTPFFLFVGTPLGLVMGFFCRYLWMANKNYHYQLTPVGVRYTTQDDIPEIAFTIARSIAWFGVIVCIFAFFIIGPMAFAGAGGMALLSFSLTGFSSKINQCYISFTENYEIKIFRDGNVFSLQSEPFKILEYGEVHCENGKLNEVLNKFLPHLKNYTFKEITKLREL